MVETGLVFRLTSTKSFFCIDCQSRFQSNSRARCALGEFVTSVILFSFHYYSKGHLKRRDLTKVFASWPSFDSAQNWQKNWSRWHWAEFWSALLLSEVPRSVHRLVAFRVFSTLFAQDAKNDKKPSRNQSIYCSFKLGQQHKWHSSFVLRDLLNLLFHFWNTSYLDQSWRCFRLWRFTVRCSRFSFDIFASAFILEPICDFR